MQSQYVSLNFWFGGLIVLQCIIVLLIMAYKHGHVDRPARSQLLKRVVGFVIVGALLSLIWFDAAAPAASALTGDERLDVHTQLRNVTTPSRKDAPHAPFPTLPPPDNEEYMAICMAGNYL